MKKILLLVCALLLSLFVVKAQTKNIEVPAPENFEIKEPSDSLKSIQEFKIDQSLTEENNSADIAPSYPGGLESFYKYLSENIHYPKGAARKHIQGKVFLTFVVEKDGHVTSAKVVRGVSEDIDAEAVRVVDSSPKWNPGIQNKRPVRVQYTMPLDFKL